MFENRVALVTGGTRGIGQAVALALASRDCRVHVTGVSDQEVSEFRTDNPAISASRLDVAEPEAVLSLAAGLQQLDILVNCAGIILRDGQEFEPQQFERVVDVNLSGTMRMSTACREMLGQRGGAIVNIASMLSFFGGAAVPAYSSSKGGIVQLTKSLAVAWAEDGIRVNAVAPGWIETEMTRPLYEDPQRNQQILERTPMRRWGQPENVAEAVVFLCSDAAAFITGAVLPVDGGYSAC